MNSAKVPALASSARVRRGSASIVARIIPVEYSEEISIAPSTHTARLANCTPGCRISPIVSCRNSALVEASRVGNSCV